MPGRNGLSLTLNDKYAVEKISNGKSAVYSQKQLCSVEDTNYAV